MTRSRWAWIVALICNLGLFGVWIWSRPAGKPMPGSKWIAWPRWLLEMPSWLRGLSLPEQNLLLPYALAIGVIGIGCVAGLSRTARWRKYRVLPALESATAWAESLALTAVEGALPNEDASAAPWPSGGVRLIAGERWPIKDVIEPFSSRGLPVLVVGSGTVRREVMDSDAGPSVEYLPGATPTDTVLAWCATHPQGLVAVSGTTALESRREIDVADALLSFGEKYRAHTEVMASVFIVEPVPVERLVLDASLRKRCARLGVELWAVVNGVCQPVKASEPQTLPALLVANSADVVLSESAQRWVGRAAFVSRVRSGAIGGSSSRCSLAICLGRSGATQCFGRTARV
jgi:hypothetical protein